MKLKKRRSLLFIAAYLILVAAFVAGPIYQHFQGKVWFAWGYHNYLAPLLEQHNPVWSLWREQVGEATYPSFLNLLYYWPFKILSAVLGGYAAWIVYVYLIFVLAGIFFALYLRRLFTSLSLSKGLLLGLLYTSFIPINLEGGFNLKVAASFLPLGLWLILVSQRWGWMLLTLLIANLAFFEPRALIAFFLLAGAQFVYLWLVKEQKTALLAKTAGSFLLSSVLAFILFWPIQKAYAAYLQSVQISVPVQESVVTYLFGPGRFFFHPNPAWPQSWSTAWLVGLALAGLLVYLFINRRLPQLKKVLLLVALLAVLYFLLLFKPLLSLLTLHLPYGQLFRSWRVAEYLAGFILPLFLIAPLVLSKRWLQFGVIGLAGVYFLASAVLFSQQQIYLKAEDIQPYFEVNDWLKKDGGDFKVLWVPEMGWFAKDQESARPFWLDDQATGQSFPEFISSKPTYGHYNHPLLTHFYTWLASGNWHSQLQENPRAAEFLNILGVKYLIVHDDVTAYHDAAQVILANLAQGSDFRKVFESGYIQVWENKLYRGRIWVTPQAKSVWCESGLNCLEEFLTAASTYDYTLYPTDQKIELGSDAPAWFFSSASELSDEDYYNLLVSYFLQGDPLRTQGVPLFPRDFFDRQKLTACLSDTHHGIYHYYFDTQEEYDYALNFEPDSCFFVLSVDQTDFTLPVKLEKGEYVLLLRYLTHPYGGDFSLYSQAVSLDISAAYDSGQLNRYQYLTKKVQIDQEKQIELNLANFSGLNLISLIAFIPADEFQETLENLKQNFTPLDFQSDLNISADAVKILQITREDSSHWTIQVQADQPFILSFAESYHPFWRAKIYQNGKLLEGAPAQPAYGAVNSFWINSTGQLQIELKYPSLLELFK